MTSINFNYFLLQSCKKVFEEYIEKRNCLRKRDIYVNMCNNYK